MKLYVPTPGDCLKLTADWTFTVYNDWQNWNFLNAMKLPRVRAQQCTLPAGTRLNVCYWNSQGVRTYWDHVVFYLYRKEVEFRVGLPDINQIDCEIQKPRRKPVRQPGDYFDCDCEDELNEYLLDEESEIDWGKVWEKEDKSERRREQRSEQEDGWDDSFQPTLIY